MGTDEIALEVTRGLRLLLGFCLAESPREKDGNALGRFGFLHWLVLVGGPNVGYFGAQDFDGKNQMEWSAAVVQI